MKTLFENWRKFVNEEESKPEEIEKKINSKLDAEGGAAGLEPLVKAAQEIDPDATEEDVKQMLDGMSNVEQHEKGDYIDAKDLSEVEKRASLAQNRINKAVAQAKEFQRRELMAVQYANDLKDQNEKFYSGQFLVKKIQLN